jgi:hypothetical protein
MCARFSLAATVADLRSSAQAGSPLCKPIDPQSVVLAVDAAGGPRIAALNVAA